MVIWRIALSTKPDDELARDDDKVPDIIDSKEKDNFSVNNKKLLILTNNQCRKVYHPRKSGSDTMYTKIIGNKTLIF